MEKELKIFKEFQREMLKRKIDVKVVYEISQNIKDKFNIQIPKSNKTFKQILEGARKL